MLYCDSQGHGLVSGIHSMKHGEGGCDIVIARVNAVLLLGLHSLKHGDRGCDIVIARAMA